MDASLMSARERLDHLRREAHVAAAEAALIAARIAQATCSAWSRGREVRITVGPDGLVQDAEFTEDALELTPRALAAATLAAHDGALALLRAAVEDAVAAAPPSVRSLADEVAAGARSALPAAEPWRDDRR